MTKRVPQVGDEINFMDDGPFHKVLLVGVQDEFIYQTGNGLWIANFNAINKYRDEVNRPTTAKNPGDICWIDGKKHVAMSPPTLFDKDDAFIEEQIFSNKNDVIAAYPNGFKQDQISWPALTVGPDGKPTPVIYLVPVEDDK